SQLLVALELQQETGQQLGQILVERFGVARSDLAKIVAEHWARLGQAEEQATTRASESWRQLGEILVDRGFVTREQLIQALERQRQTGERLGEALIGQGVLSKFELAGSLAEQASTVGEPGADEQPEPAAVVPLMRMDLSVDRDTESPFRREPDVGWGRNAEDADEPETRPVAESHADAEPQDESTVVPEPETAAGAWPTMTLVPPPPEPTFEGAQETTPTPETDADEHAPDAPLEEEHAVAAYVAYASTPRGYRLLVVEDGALPDVGARMELPELGELVVLRYGVSPLPSDERACVFLEPPVPAAHAADTTAQCLGL
ncbi:MAG TPA: hypothetical protein VFM41_15030, partial [Gaiella sp.]|nr:hypothetical protein [Gaiella sp.]